MARRELKVVRLLEPDLCLDCRFARIADVETKGAPKQRMIYCTRLDCDNWDMQTAEPASAVDIHEA
jgi:hypothetical protein